MGTGITPSIERMADKFASLPGIGRKSAMRLAFHVLGMENEMVRDFADALLTVKERTRICPVCMNFCEDEFCPLCSDNGRDKSIICVVEDPRAARVIEDLKEYNGMFHILHGVISPIDGIGPDQIKIKELLIRTAGDTVKEVIIATNPSVEGEATALYIGKLLRPLGVKVTRLAYGLPVGASLEYADSIDRKSVV